MAGKWFTVLAIDGFTGGRLTINVHYGVMFMSNHIKTEGPGSVVITDRFRGPKEWSPHGTIPKGWIEVACLKNPCQQLSVAFRDSDKTEKRIYFTLNQKDKQGVYFAPGTGELSVPKTPGAAP